MLRQRDRPSTWLHLSPGVYWWRSDCNSAMGSSLSNCVLVCALLWMQFYCLPCGRRVEFFICFIFMTEKPKVLPCRSSVCYVILLTTCICKEYWSRETGMVFLIAVFFKFKKRQSPLYTLYGVFQRLSWLNSSQRTNALYCRNGVNNNNLIIKAGTDHLDLKPMLTMFDWMVDN